MAENGLGLSPLRQRITVTLGLKVGKRSPRASLGPGHLVQMEPVSFTSSLEKALPNSSRNLGR